VTLTTSIDAMKIPKPSIRLEMGAIIRTHFFSQVKIGSIFGT